MQNILYGIWIIITGDAGCFQVQFFKEILTDDAIIWSSVGLPGCPAFDLNFLRIIEGEKGLDDMEASIFFYVLIQQDEISSSSEGISHKGDDIRIDCPHNPRIPNRRLVFFS